MLNEPIKNKNDLISILQCPACYGAVKRINDTLQCIACKTKLRFEHGKVFYTDPPENINPTELRERGPQTDTPWRQANTHFLIEQLEQLPGDSLILDVGAGRGDLLPHYARFPHVLVDVYPYPEVDIVCDLTTINPFQPSSFDVILLMNVLEHVYSPKDMLASLEPILKPGGKIMIAIPFLLKIHQAPLDFQRLTHFSLQRMAQEVGLQVVHLNAFYDPLGLMHEPLRYYQFWVRPVQSRISRLFSGVILEIVKLDLWFLSLFSPKACTASPFEAKNPAPVGYQLVLQKPF